MLTGMDAPDREGAPAAASTISHLRRGVGWGEAGQRNGRRAAHSFGITRERSATREMTCRLAGGTCARLCPLASLPTTHNSRVPASEKKALAARNKFTILYSDEVLIRRDWCSCRGRCRGGQLRAGGAAECRRRLQGKVAPHLSDRPTLFPAFHPTIYCSLCRARGPLLAKPATRKGRSTASG